MRRSFVQESTSKLIVPKIFENKSNLVSEKYFQEHIKLYNGYFEKINDNIDNLFLNSYFANGAILHEYYFEQFTGNNNQPSEKAMENLFYSDKYYYENWKTEFVDLALKSKEGWVIFAYDVLTKSYKNILLELHDKGIVSGCNPMIVLDTFAHAYWGDYGADKKQYIEKFMEEIDWNIILQRITTIKKAAPAE